MTVFFEFVYVFPGLYYCPNKGRQESANNKTFRIPKVSPSQKSTQTHIVFNYAYAVQC